MLIPTTAGCLRVIPRRCGGIQLDHEPPRNQGSCGTTHPRTVVGASGVRASSSTDRQRSSCTTSWEKPGPCLSCPPQGTVFTRAPFIDIAPREPGFERGLSPGPPCLVLASPSDPPDERASDRVVACSGSGGLPCPNFCRQRCCLRAAGTLVPLSGLVSASADTIPSEMMKRKRGYFHQLHILVTTEN